MRGYYALKKIPRDKYTIALLLIIGIGIILRIWGYPHLPVGFNQDEASAGYEAYSIYHIVQEQIDGGIFCHHISCLGGQTRILFTPTFLPH